MKTCWLKAFAVVCLVGGWSLNAVPINAQEKVEEEFMVSGATRLQGGYSPIRAEMDEEADSVGKTPDDLKNPKFGFLVQGDLKWQFILDEPEEGEAKLYVDTNADGDFTNDPAAEWTSKKQGEYVMYNGNASVEIAPEKLGTVNMYRFDPTDTRREQLKNTLLYYFDYGTKYKITIDGKTIETGTAGSLSEGDSLPLDRNDDGKTSRNYEMVKIGEPFNFTGTTYVLNVEGGALKIAKADKELPMAPMPPDLRLGKQALNFSATTIDGEEIEFPTTFKGRVVMLDFWATWCGPCVAEIPNMKKAYASWHDQGFEILGISFDQEDKEEMLQEYRKKKELPWPQIYDGKYWDTVLGKKHDVSGIPFVLLVDGDTGEILGTSRELRGPKLAAFIGEKLLEKELITKDDLVAFNAKEEEKKDSKKKDDKEKEGGDDGN
jgi:thiol-disulfide isomerase/thioredoxin